LTTARHPSSGASRAALSGGTWHERQTTEEAALAALGGGIIATYLSVVTELRRPLDITTIIGGVGVSQILTLCTTPVIYLLIDRLRRRPEPKAIAAPAE